MNYALLNAREKTDAFEKKLLRQFDGKTLVTVRANIPGIKKGCLELNYIVYKIFLECKKAKTRRGFSFLYGRRRAYLFFNCKKRSCKNKTGNSKNRRNAPARKAFGYRCCNFGKNYFAGERFRQKQHPYLPHMFFVRAACKILFKKPRSFF